MITNKKDEMNSKSKIKVTKNLIVTLKTLTIPKITIHIMETLEYLREEKAKKSKEHV